MKSHETQSSLTSLDAPISSSVYNNVPNLSRRCSLVDCYAGNRRRSLVELPAAALSRDGTRRHSHIYLDTNQRWSLAEYSTLHSRSEEIDTSSLSYDASRNNEPKGAYQPLPGNVYQENDSTTMTVPFTSRSWRSIILGQLVAFIFSLMSVYHIYISEVYMISMPTTLNLVHYVFMCTVFLLDGKPLHLKDRLVSLIKKCGWQYMLVAVVDVEANYLLSRSLQLESFTITQLLSCIALPLATILSSLVLCVRYHNVHIIGLALGLTSIACIAWADIIGGTLTIEGFEKNHDNVLYVIGTILFATVTVLDEWTLRSLEKVEFLGMIGLIGTLISCIQVGVIESRQLIGLFPTNWSEVGMVMGYALIQLTFTVLMVIMIQEAGAVLLHLSLASSHFYLNLIKCIVLQLTKFHVLYTMHFIAAVLGIMIFASKRLTVVKHRFSSVSIPFPSLEPFETKDVSEESSPLHNRLTTTS